MADKLDEASRARIVAIAEYGILQTFAKEGGLDLLKDCNIEDFPVHLGQLMHDFRSTYDSGGVSAASKAGPVVPMLNLFGVIYPFLDKPKRETVLRANIQTLEGLDGKDGAVPVKEGVSEVNGMDGAYRVNGMDAVSRIHEPLLAADTIINTGISLWPDLSEYRAILKEGVMPEVFDKRILVGDGTGPKSLFWAAYSVSRVDEYDSSLIRAQFFDRFSKMGLMGRTCEAIAAIMHNSAVRDDVKSGDERVLYQKGIENRLPIYAEECRERIVSALKRETWVYLPETAKRKPTKRSEYH